MKTLRDRSFANYTFTTSLKFPFTLLPVLLLCSCSHFLTWLTSAVLKALPPETSLKCHLLYPVLLINLSKLQFYYHYCFSKTFSDFH